MTGLLTLPLFTRLLTPADYGAVAMLSLISMVATPIFGVGIGVALGIVYSQQSSEADRVRVARVATTISVITAATFLVIGFALRDGLAVLLVPEIPGTDLVTIAVVSTTVGILGIPLRGTIQLRGQAAAFAGIGFATALLALATHLTLVVGLRMGVIGLMSGTIVAQAVGTLAAWRLAMRRTGLAWDTSVALSLLRLGLPMVPSFASVFVIGQVSRYVLRYTHGIDAVGIFSVGANIGMTLGLATGAFASAWTPYFLALRDRPDTSRLLFGRVTTYYVWITGGMSLLYFFFAPTAMDVLVAEPYRQGYIAIGYAASAQFFTGLFGLLMPGPYFADDVKSVAITQGIAAVVAVCLAVILIPPLGLIGACVATATAGLALCVTQAAWNWKMRHRYLTIHYETGRLTVFGLAYVGAVLLFSARPWIHAIPDVVAGLSATVALAVLITVLTSASERRVAFYIARGRYRSLRQLRSIVRY